MATLGHRGIRRPTVAVLDDIQHPVEALAANIADHLVFRLEPIEFARRDLAKRLGAFGKLVAQYDFQLLQRDGGDKGVAGIGACPG